MSPLFFLANDFIERMTNPRYGTRENEDYALKFAELLRSEGAEAVLRREAERVSDINTLTPYGWIWLLNWARSTGISLNGDVLSSLMEQWQSPMVLSLIIDVATQGQEENTTSVFDVRDFRGVWLRSVMVKCITTPERPYGSEEESPQGYSGPYPEGPDINFAKNVLLALLQCDTTVSLNAAASLLRQSWSGRDQLQEFFYQRIALMDEESRRLWLQRLAIE